MIFLDRVTSFHVGGAFHGGSSGASTCSAGDITTLARVVRVKTYQNRSELRVLSEPLPLRKNTRGKDSAFDILGSRSSYM